MSTHLSLRRHEFLVSVIIIIVLSLLLFFMLSESAHGASSITITNPDGTTFIAENSDFAIDKFGDPWDMSQLTDISYGNFYSNISGFSVAGGVMSGTSATNDPGAFLHHPGQAGAIQTNRDGSLCPIDASYYNAVSVRMYSSTWTNAQIYWFYNSYWNDFGVTNFFISPGWNTYIIDLSSIPSWTGQPLGIRIDPATDAGVSFQIDWFKLYRAGQTSLSVEWSDISPGGWASIYLDVDATPDNGNETYVGGQISGASNTRQIDTSPYAAGPYYIYIKKSGENTLPALVTINQPPLIQVLDPDATGGEDYATATGDAWDMNQLTDVAGWFNVTGVSVNSGVFTGINTNGDPALYLRTPQSIDTGRYKRLTFTFGYTPPFSIGTGSVARLMWNKNGMNPYTFTTTKDIVIYPEMTTYTIYLPTAMLEPGGEGWNGWVNCFRFDPLEFPSSHGFYLDSVKLAADDEARGSFVVRWQDDKVSPRPTKISIYADSDAANFDGVELASDIDQVAGENSYAVNTNGLASGNYYIYIVADDGVNTSYRYATGLVRVYSPPQITSAYNGATLSTYYPLFTWTVVDGATGYGLELLDAPPEPSEENGTAPSIHRIAAGGTPYTFWNGNIHGLAPGTYYYRVIASNQYGFLAGFSNHDSFTVPVPPEPGLTSPTNGQTVARGPLDFTWGAIAGANTYAIELLSNNPENPNGWTPSQYRMVAAICPDGNPTFPGDATYLNGGTYWWRIIAINGDGLYGVFSDAWSFVVPDPMPILSQPSDGFNQPAKGPITFDWQDLAGADGYAIELLINTPENPNGTDASQYRLAAAFSPNGASQFPGNTAGLQSGTYYWRIIAVQGGQLYGVFSDARSFIVP